FRHALEPDSRHARTAARRPSQAVRGGGAVRAAAAPLRGGGASDRCEARSLSGRGRGDETVVRLILDSSTGGYPVLIGSNLHRELRNVIARLDPTGAAIVTDTNARPWALKVAKAIKRAGLKTSRLATPPGERSQSLLRTQAAPAFLARQQIDRRRCGTAA